MQSLGFTQSSYYLTLDRMNWQYGKRNLNFLMPSIVHKGIAMSAYWLVAKLEQQETEESRQVSKEIRKIGDKTPLM